MTNPNKKPAIFAPVQRMWIEQAFEWFAKGNDILYFSTGGAIKQAIDLEISKVYFKATSKNDVVACGDFIELTEINPISYRLQGASSSTGKYYYGFKNFHWLDNSIEVCELRYYSTGNNLLNSTPGATIIIDPF